MNFQKIVLGKKSLCNAVSGWTSTNRQQNGLQVVGCNSPDQWEDCMAATLPLQPPRNTEKHRAEREDMHGVILYDQWRNREQLPVQEAEVHPVQKV